MVFAPPPWVEALFDAGSMEARESVNGLMMSVSTIPEATFVRVCAPEAVDLDALSFQRRTVQAYGLLASALRNHPARHPVRFWNLVPDIRARAEDGIDRYMLFNAGRLVAFHNWFGAEKTFNDFIATSTGVGHKGRDLVIDVLAANRPGVHLQNPRQNRPSSYSCRYGPFPPCFARATLTHWHSGEIRLLIGGTASVRGEESVHEGELRGQTEETFSNLASIVRASIQASRGPTPEIEDLELFDAFESLRVYFPEQYLIEEIRHLVEQRIGHLDDIEYLQADICRPELLIEIEGVVRIDKLSAVR